MILSHKQIEEIAAAVTKDFNAFFFGKDTDNERSTAQATPIDQFAKDYLGLSVSFAHLSSDGSLCGLTTYVDTEYTIEEQGVKRTIPLKANQVLLDLSFIQPGQVHALCGKRRFTLAHECAHQILFGMESDNDKRTCHKRPEVRGNGSRVLRTQEDWNEWQANVLGAAILMPQKEIDIAMRQFACGRVLKNFEGRFNYIDRLSLTLLCQALGVSKSAAIIRLRQLGYIEDRPLAEYDDPLEVWL